MGSGRSPNGLRDPLKVIILVPLKKFFLAMLRINHLAFLICLDQNLQALSVAGDAQELARFADVNRLVFENFTRQFGRFTIIGVNDNCPLIFAAGFDGFRNKRIMIWSQR